MRLLAVRTTLTCRSTQEQKSLAGHDYLRTARQSWPFEEKNNTSGKTNITDILLYVIQQEARVVNEVHAESSGETQLNFASPTLKKTKQLQAVSVEG